MKYLVSILLLCLCANAQVLSPVMASSAAPTIPTTGLTVQLSGRRDNLLQYSEDLTNAIWVKSYATYSGGLLTENTTTQHHYVSQTITTPGSGVIVSWTVRAKQNTLSRLILYEVTSGPYASFDLAAGTVLYTSGSITGSIAVAPNGYYDCTVYRSEGPGLKGWTIYTLPATGQTYADSSYLGTSKSLYISRSQFNLGSTPLPYVATTDYVTWPNLTGGANGTLTNGPIQTGNTVTFDGVDDYVASLPAKAGTWSVVWANAAHVHGIDSAGNTYVDGKFTSTVDAAIATSGRFSGAVSYYLLYSRVISPAEQGMIYSVLKSQMAAWPLPVTINTASIATGVSAVNAQTYETIPYDEGTGSEIHPSVKYRPSGWNGYKYWMMLSVYPSESPELVVSNTGTNDWAYLAGATNPVVATPSGGANTDPELFWSCDGSILYFINRQVIGTAEELDLRQTTDGINWSAPVTILSDNTTNNLVSPGVVCSNGTYYMWASQTSPSNVLLRTATDPSGTWSAPTTTNLVASNVRHLGVENSDGYFRLLLTGNVGSPMNYSLSTDGITWTNSTIGTFLLGTPGSWDETEIYRPSPMRDPTGLWMYYAALNSTGFARIGRTALVIN